VGVLRQQRIGVELRTAGVATIIATSTTTFETAKYRINGGCIGLAVLVAVFLALRLVLGRRRLFGDGLFAAFGRGIFPRLVAPGAALGSRHCVA